MNNKRDNLKEYIWEHKGELDIHKAPTGLWDKIETELDQPSTTASTRWKLLIAIIVGIGVATVAYYIGAKSAISVSGTEPIQTDTKVLEFAGLEDFHETRQYYTTQVNDTWKVLQTMHNDEQLEEDLQLLDQQDKELRIELKDASGPHQEHILRALIHNQQTKLNIINEVLMEVRSAKKQNNYETI